jgi:hypothetical protein
MGSGGGGFGGGGAAAPAADSLTSVRAALLSLMGILQGADVAPTTQAVASITDRRKTIATLMTKWNELKSKDLPAVNAQLRKSNLPELKLD